MKPTSDSQPSNERLHFLPMTHVLNVRCSTLQLRLALWFLETTGLAPRKHLRGRVSHTVAIHADGEVMALVDVQAQCGCSTAWCQPLLGLLESKTKFRWYRCNGWEEQHAVHICDLSAAWQTSQSCLFHGKAPASPHQSGLRRHGRRSRRFSALSMVTVQAATERHLVVTCSHIEELRNWGQMLALGHLLVREPNRLPLESRFAPPAMALHFERLFMPFLPKEICNKLMQHNVEAILLRPPFHFWRGDALCPSGSSHTDSKCERSPNCASGSYHRDSYSLLAEWDMRRAGGGNLTLEDILSRILKNIKDVL